MNKFLAKIILKAVSSIDGKTFKLIFGDYFSSPLSSNERSSSWVYVATDILGKYFAKANFRVYKIVDNNAIEIKEHPLVDIFKNPNDYQTFWEIKYNWAFHFALYGNSYLIKIRDKFGIPRQIVQVNPFSIQPYYENKQLKYYKFITPSENKILPVEDVIHLKYPNPENMLEGKPIISNILSQVEVDVLQTKYQQQFYRSGGFLGQTFIAKQELSAKTFERLKAELEKRYGGGYENSYKVGLLELVEPVKHAYSIKDMELTLQRQLARDEILAAFQIPKILAGIGDNINRATAEASIFQFTSGVVDPLTSYFGSILTQSFSKDFKNGDKLLIEPDPLAPKDVEANIKYYQAGLNMGWLTLNEVREAENYPRLELSGADEPIVAVNRMPLSNWYNNQMGNIVNNNFDKNMKQEEDGLKIQTLIFSKKYFTLEEAKKWIEEHGFVDNGVDETENSYRFRQRDPEDFDPESFRTITIDTGIKAVVGKLKNDNKNYSTIDYISIVTLIN
ncbi:MAG: phage portal protein [Ignavibacterium sp.]|nr:phage portal protein [Ignavibacterium sp.]